MTKEIRQQWVVVDRRSKAIVKRCKDGRSARSVAHRLDSKAGGCVYISRPARDGE